MGTWPLNLSGLSAAEPSQTLAELYHQQSPLYFKGDTKDGAEQLPLFGSVNLQTCTDNSGSDHGKKHATTELGREHVLDTIFYVGGLVWKVDWCPALETTPAPFFEHLAVAVHPKDHSANEIGFAKHGQNMIQVWAVPTVHQNTPASLCAPTLVLSIIHDGFLAWDLKWCPDTAALQRHFTSATGVTGTGSNLSDQHDPEVACLGVVALALGDGSVQILSVPDPQQLPNNMTTAAGCLRRAFLRITPAATISPEQLSGSLPSCLDWQQFGPHCQLLVGCWDGTVSCWELPPVVQGSCRALLRVQADTLSIRSLAWMPSNVKPSVDGFERQFFVTAGNTGRIKIWDCRDLVAPVMEKLLARAWVPGVCWTTEPLQVNAVLSDGSVRQVVIESGVVAAYPDMTTAFLQGEIRGCLWCLAHSRAAKMCAYAGEDGVVGVWPVQRILDSRRQRKPHAAIGGFRTEDCALRMLSWQDLQKQPGIFSGPKNPGLAKQADDGPFPDLAQSVYAAAFSPNGGPVAWLAYGGHAGFVRCQRVGATI